MAEELVKLGYQEYFLEVRFKNRPKVIEYGKIILPIEPQIDDIIDFFNLTTYVTDLIPEIKGNLIQIKRFQGKSFRVIHRNLSISGVKITIKEI